jgi:hypothetical protein
VDPDLAEAVSNVPFTKQQLLDVAATFVKLWFAGIAKGPQAVEQELASILPADVVIKADRVKHFEDTQVRRKPATPTMAGPQLHMYQLHLCLPMVPAPTRSSHCCCCTHRSES